MKHRVNLWNFITTGITQSMPFLVNLNEFMDFIASKSSFLRLGLLTRLVIFLVSLKNVWNRIMWITSNKQDSSGFPRYPIRWTKGSTPSLVRLEDVVSATPMTDSIFCFLFWSYPVTFQCFKIVHRLDREVKYGFPLCLDSQFHGL